MTREYYKKRKQEFAEGYCKRFKKEIEEMVKKVIKEVAKCKLTLEQKWKPFSREEEKWTKNLNNGENVR